MPYKTKTITVFVLTLLFQTGVSQSIFSTTELKRGLYRNFTEFVTNNPTIPFDDEKMEFKQDEELLVDNITSKLFVTYGTQIQLPIFKLQYKKNKKSVNTKSFWGYCDGAKVFINSYTHIPKHFFVEIILVGRYCYFIQAGTVSNVQPASAFNNPFDPHRDVEEYIINVNNGKIFNLDKTVLRTILESDKELLNEFNDDKHTNRKLLVDYIQKYNERHVDEIKMLQL